MESGGLRPKVLPTKDANIVKIAVEMNGRAPQLIPFDQKQPLTVIIQDLCNLWSLTDMENYALKFNMDSNKKFICEKNRLEVKNGFVLQLDYSPAYVSHEILARFALTSSDDRMKAAQQLVGLADDPTFAADFSEKNGIETIIGLVEGKHTEPIFPFLLPAFVDLMEHGIMQWEVVGPPFIARMANLITNQATPQEIRTLQAALAILENVVLNSSKYNLVEKELTLPNLAMHLQNASRPIQQNTLALINALFLKADDSKRVAIAGTLNVRQIRNSIVMNIIQSNFNS
jgi:engulfment and cell motility protein 1